MESFETDQSNFKEKILHLLTDEPKLEKVYEIQKYWQNIDKVVNLLHFQLATFQLPRYLNESYDYDWLLISYQVYLQENSQDQEEIIFDEDHKCIILDVGTYIPIVL